MLRRRSRAAAAGHVRFTAHAFAELGAAKLTLADAGNCFLTGTMVKDQYDARYRPRKYLICGDTRAGDELGLRARFEETTRVLVITVYRWQLDDDD